MLLRHCAQVPCSEQQNLVKNRVETGAWIAWIMAEIKPAYSFEPMRDSSELEEDNAHERQDERRRGNTSWCVCECCANWEGQQEKEWHWLSLGKFALLMCTI